MITAASPGCRAKRRSLTGRTFTAARPTWLVITAITLVAALLRVVPWLADYPLHRDEALYGYWARLIASGRDPLLLTPWIDKPPFSIYASASSFTMLGVSELALRLPGMIASILTVPAIYALTCRAFGERTARLAAGLFALSPFAVLFAPTAFTDPWMMLWLVVAAWAALAQRGLIAGLAVGLAVASKQQGLLAAPLALGLLLIPPAGASSVVGGSRLDVIRRPAVRRVLAAILGFALIFGPLTYWDSLRWHNRPSFWDRSLATYGPFGLAGSSEWVGRAGDWAGQLGYVFGHPALSGLMLGLASVAAILAVRPAIEGRAPDRQDRLDLVLGSYVIGYLTLHIVVTFQPWDRYLLPLVPLVCMLSARGLLHLTHLISRKSRVCGAGVALALAAALGYAAWSGAMGQIPVGSDHGAYAGVRQVADTIRDQPDETVIYHRSLGWYFDFYLFDTPQERRWFDTGDKLADEAARTAELEPERPQWLITTDQEADSTEALRPVLAAQKLTLTPSMTVRRPDGSRSFAIYEIVPMARQGEQ